MQKTYRAKIEKIVSGDVFYALVDYGFKRRGTEMFKLKNVYVPHDRREAKEAALAVFENICPEGTWVDIVSYKNRDVHNKYMADVFFRDGATVKNLASFVQDRIDEVMKAPIGG
jgi:hypothetical protein